jgi:putative transposase
MALEGDSNVIETVVQLLSQHDGLSHMAEVVRILLKEAMKVERAQALEASPYERSVKRRGYANGF